MATSQIKALHEASGRLVAVVGRGNRPMWSEVFENNPRVSPRGGAGITTLVNGPNVRPYIAEKQPTRWVWKKWQIRPGELFFNPEERAAAEPYRGCVFIEPHTKVPQGNKAWPWERWQALVDQSHGINFVQAAPVGSKFLHGVLQVHTERFRQAAALLSVSRAFVGCEGALHHAAAALCIPAVVLWSEFISPDITGYPTQRNIRHAGAPCGSRVPCSGCRESMEKITVSEVKRELEEVCDVVEV